MERKLTMIQVDLEQCRCGVGAHGDGNGPTVFITMFHNEFDEPIVDDEARRQIKTIFPQFE
jgi:hypothetical protein